MQIAEYLADNVERIVVLWRERVLREVGPSAQVSLEIMEDEIRAFLKFLAKSVSQSHGGRSEYKIEQDRLEALRFAEVHGAERAKSVFYRLADMVHEFQVLRQILFQECEKVQPLTTAQRETLLYGFESAVRDAASKFAETQMDMQQQFTLTLVHDLRNPIAVAKMNAQMMSRLPHASSEVLRASKTINDKMDRLESMLRELLDASRLNAGAECAPERAKVRMDALAREVAAELASVHGNRFTVIADEEVSGDWNVNGLRRIVENLATNAVKYSYADTAITIEVKNKKDRAELSVHNSGEPIPPEEQPHLFDFYRRSRSAHGKTGWGLGLSMVLAMTQAHHGRVHVESSRENGTRFWVDLPKVCRCRPLTIPH